MDDPQPEGPVREGRRDGVCLRSAGQGFWWNRARTWTLTLDRT